MDSKPTFLKPDEFIKQFEENQKLDKYVAIYYSGLDESGTKYWCSDTVEAAPYVDKSIVPKLTESNIKFDFVDCLDRPTFKDPNFVLRSSHNLAKVPTGVEKARLVEMDCYDDDEIKTFLEGL